MKKLGILSGVLVLVAATSVFAIVASSRDVSTASQTSEAMSVQIDSEESTVSKASYGEGALTRSLSQAAQNEKLQLKTRSIELQVTQSSSGTICETPSGTVCKVRSGPINSKCECNGSVGRIAR